MKPTPLRKFRKISRFTQDELSFRSRINQARISRLESGFVRPSLRERINLSRALKVPTEILFPEV
jgi:transcriptional regulator with XRE-family HTH domain